MLASFTNANAIINVQNFIRWLQKFSLCIEFARELGGQWKQQNSFQPGPALSFLFQPPDVIWEGKGHKEEWEEEARVSGQVADLSQSLLDRVKFIWTTTLPLIEYWLIKIEIEHSDNNYQPDQTPDIITKAMNTSSVVSLTLTAKATHSTNTQTLKKQFQFYRQCQLWLQSWDLFNRLI